VVCVQAVLYIAVATRASREYKAFGDLSLPRPQSDDFAHPVLFVKANVTNLLVTTCH
jgi:hypothetical protein